MDAWPARRVAALGALAVVVLWVVGFFLAGKPPAFAASSDTVAAFFHDHHKQVLIASVLVAIGIAVYLFVLAQLRVELRGAGQRTCASIAGLGASASAAVFAIGDAIYGELAQATASHGGDAGLVQALYQLDQFAGVPMYWLVTVVLGAVFVAARRGAFPSWSVWLTGVLGVLVVLGGISVKATGVFAAGTGLFATLGFAAALVFLLEIAVLLWTLPEREAD
jgi:hypothetical protein